MNIITFIYLKMYASYIWKVSNIQNKLVKMAPHIFKTWVQSESLEEYMHTRDSLH